jgi:hypothetical protein
VLADGRQRFEKIRRCRKMREAFGKLAAIALAETGDQRFLAIEINVECTGADTRLATDRLHRRGVKAAACEARQCSVEDVIAPGALRIWLEPGHVLAGNLK